MSSSDFSDIAQRLGLNIISGKDYLDNYFDSDVKNLQDAPRIMTGLSNLDEFFKGLSAGLYILGGTPGLGKTTLIHQIAVNIAESGQPVLFFSMELSTQFLISKELARKTFIELLNRKSILPAPSARDLHNGRVVDPNLLTFVDSARRNSRNSNIIYVTGNKDMTVENISAITQHFIDVSGKKPVVFVDYLQRTHTDLQGTDKQRVDKIVKDLWNLKEKISMPTFLVAALNRMSYVKPIEMESFKDSGGVEYSADFLIGLQLQVIRSDLFLSSERNFNAIERTQCLKLHRERIPRLVELSFVKTRAEGEPSFGFIYDCVHDFFIPDNHYKNRVFEKDGKDTLKSDAQHSDGIPDGE